MQKQIATKRNRFQRGSGVYSCGNCTRKTRSTGNGDNEHLRLCAECYELGGIENEISDCGSTPEREAECDALRRAIVAKGGKLEGYAPAPAVPAATLPLQELHDKLTAVKAANASMQHMHECAGDLPATVYRDQNHEATINQLEAIISHAQTAIAALKRI